MKKLSQTQTKNCAKNLQEKCLLLIFLSVILLGGCSIWDKNLHPNYESSRADRLCHPYGECSQGVWVAVNGAEQDPTVAKMQCAEAIDQRYGKGWWTDTVSRGLEIGKCMEEKGYQLQQ